MTGTYCLVQGRVWRFYQRNADRLDPLSGLINLITPGGKQQTYVYNMRGVMEIYRFSTLPGGFAARLLFSLLLSISICVVKYDGIIVRIP